MAHKHSVYDTDPHFSINPATRVIKNESTTKTGIIQHDHNSERFTFEIPRLVDGHDMSLCNVIQVHYINIDSITKEQNTNVYEATDKQVLKDEDGSEYVVFSWLISQNATMLVGSLNFLVRFSCVAEDGIIEYVWNTGIHSGISVSTGMCNSQTIVEEYPDILAQWRQELFEAGGDAVVNVNTAKENALTEIQTEGATQVGAVVAKGEETLDSIPDDYTELSRTVDKNSEINSINGKRITNIDHGFTASTLEADDTVAYSKVIPSVAPPFAEIQKVGGMTRKCTNLIPFPYRHTNKTENGITWTVNADGTVTANGTATAESKFTTGYFTIKANTSYCYTGCPQGGSETTYYVKASGFGNDIGNGKNISCPYDFESTQILTICSGYTAKNLVFKPMVNEGVEAKPYEPYFEGLRSAPVTEVVSVGVNLWDEQWETTPNGYVASKNFIPVKPNTQYFITTRPSNGVNLYDANKNYIGVEYNKTFSTRENTYYIKFTLEGAYGSTYKNDICLNVFNSEINGKYYPYNKNTLPIPKAVQDLDGYGDGVNESVYNYIDWKKKQFVKNVKRIVVDGVNVAVNSIAEYTNGVLYAIVKLPKYGINGEEYLKVSRFQEDAHVVLGNAYVTGNGGTFVMVNQDQSLTTIEQWNAWLGENPVTVVYALATPEITDISDLITADNFIAVEPYGTLTFENEHQYDVPSTVMCKVKAQ